MLNRDWANRLNIPRRSEMVFVGEPSDLPAPVGGVRTLADNVTYFFTSDVDLMGDRLVGGRNTTLIGGSSENCRLKSTGLVGAALITSQWSMPTRFLAIEADVALDLDATGNADQALDWQGVNFVDCGTIGCIKGYTNVLILNGAFIDSGDLDFDGTIGTVGFDGCLFQPPTGENAVNILPTATITRRFRVIYSAAVIGAGAGGFNVMDPSVIVANEAFILDTVNFSGSGTYLPGVDHTSNKTLFVRCTGIINTSVNAQMYMRGNAVATVVTNTSDFFKVAGTTSLTAESEKYTHSDNRLTNDAAVERTYQLMCSVSFSSGNNNEVQFGFYDSKLGAVRSPSVAETTANNAGRSENVVFMCTVQHSQGDYIEIHTKNTTAANDVTVTELNVTITEIN